MDKKAEVSKLIDRSAWNAFNFLFKVAVRAIFADFFLSAQNPEAVSGDL